ncbi:MAG: trigger factor, partial [Chloroflexota bacterium]
VAFGDLLVLDVSGDSAGESFIKQKSVQYFVMENAAAPLNGFPEQLVGMTKGAPKEFKLTVPEDYPKKEWAAREVAFKVTVTEIKGEKLPEADDALARQVDAEFKTLAELREKAKSGLQERAEARARQEMENEAVEAVAAQAQVSYPPVMVEAEIDRLFEDQTRRMQMDEKALEEYLKNMKKTREELREELRPTAEKMVVNSLVLGKLADDEKIEIEDADIDAEIERMCQGAGADAERMRDALNHGHNRDSIRQLLLTRKTLSRLTEIAAENQPKKKPGKSKKEDKK